jgi:Zn-finger nucleic acid-binding protein
MQIRDRHGIEIDLCPACRGVWLDKGELEQVLERSGRFLEVPGEDAHDRRGGLRRNDFYGKGFEWF